MRSRPVVSMASASRSTSVRRAAVEPALEHLDAVLPDAAVDAVGLGRHVGPKLRRRAASPAARRAASCRRAWPRAAAAARPLTSPDGDGAIASKPPGTGGGPGPRPTFPTLPRAVAASRSPAGAAPRRIAGVSGLRRRASPARAPSQATWYTGFTRFVPSGLAGLVVRRRRSPRSGGSSAGTA